ncbi:MAG: four helix bundle protein [Terrimicrobiaceae bacterium]|jgi:four helix bundle protein
MNFAERFEDLNVWKRSREFVNIIYDMTAECRDFEFRDQIRSAALSVMNNIAEGFERRTKKDFAHFLDLAKGSAGEVRSMLYLAEDRKYVNPTFAFEIREQYSKLSSSIGSLASKLRNPR